MFMGGLVPGPIHYRRGLLHPWAASLCSSEQVIPIALSYQLWKLASLLPPESLSAVEGHGFRRVDRALPSTKRRPFGGERVAVWI